jgi:hypothetical protein
MKKNGRADSFVMALCVGNYRRDDCAVKRRSLGARDGCALSSDASVETLDSHSAIG